MASSLARLFGSGKKGDGGPSPQVAIEKLRNTEEMLNKKSEYLERKIQEQIALAKKHGMKNKRGERVCVHGRASSYASHTCTAWEKFNSDFSEYIHSQYLLLGMKKSSFLH